MAVTGIDLIRVAYARLSFRQPLSCYASPSQAGLVLGPAREHPGRIAKRSLFLSFASPKPKQRACLADALESATPGDRSSDGAGKCANDRRRFVDQGNSCGGTLARSKALSGHRENEWQRQDEWQIQTLQGTGEGCGLTSRNPEIFSATVTPPDVAMRTMPPRLPTSSPSRWRYSPSGRG